MCCVGFKPYKQVFFNPNFVADTPPTCLPAPLKTPWPRMALNPGHKYVLFLSALRNQQSECKWTAAYSLLESEVLCPNVACSYKFFISLEKDSYLKRHYNKRISLERILFRNKPLYEEQILIFMNTESSNGISSHLLELLKFNTSKLVIKEYFKKDQECCYGEGI